MPTQSYYHPLQNKEQIHNPQGFQFDFICCCLVFIATPGNQHAKHLVACYIGFDFPAEPDENPLAAQWSISLTCAIRLSSKWWTARIFSNVLFNGVHQSFSLSTELHEGSPNNKWTVTCLFRHHFSAMRFTGRQDYI